MRIEHGRSFADFDPELRRDALSEFHRNIGLTRPAIIRRSNCADGWKRKFIGDKRIVRRKRGREKSRASEAMAVRAADRGQLTYPANKAKK